MKKGENVVAFATRKEFKKAMESLDKYQKMDELKTYDEIEEKTDSAVEEDAQGEATSFYYFDRNKVIDKGDRKFWKEFMADETISQTEKSERILEALHYTIIKVADEKYDYNGGKVIPSLSVEDLRSAAIIEVLKYVPKYDGSSMPSSYFMGAIQDGVSTCLRQAEGVTKYQNRVYREIKAGREALTDVGIMPSDENVALLLHKQLSTVKVTEQMQRCKRTIKSLDEMTTDEWNSVSYQTDFVDDYVAKVEVEALHKYLASLNQLDRILLYAFATSKKMNYKRTIENIRSYKKENGIKAPKKAGYSTPANMNNRLKVLFEGARKAIEAAA